MLLYFNLLIIILRDYLTFFNCELAVISVINLIHESTPISILISKIATNYSR